MRKRTGAARGRLRTPAPNPFISSTPTQPIQINPTQPESHPTRISCSTIEDQARLTRTRSLFVFKFHSAPPVFLVSLCRRAPAPPRHRITSQIARDALIVAPAAAMDINNIKDQVSNLTLYDIKAGFRKAQNGTRMLPGHSCRPTQTD